jgi:2-alkenal reductase
MNSINPTNRNKHYLWVAGLSLLILSLFVGAISGGAAGYVIAANLADEAQPVIVEPAMAVSSDISPNSPSLPAINMPAVRESQSLVITEESATVQAVEKVLPAVVTVLNQTQDGGGSGSGFFIDQNGYLVTNNHVVEGARSLTVIYAQGGRAPATLVGTAPEFDLAVLRVDGPVPAVAEWGDSGELPLGTTVIAIGSALGQYQNSVTAGILSGFNRQLGGLNGLLQTDAAINSGNSGGPLINIAGQIIGINTMVVRGGFSGDAEGLGFAIPSNIAQNVARNLIETGEARHPFLGIQYRQLNPQLAAEAGLNITQGALLDTIIDGAPAERAGLRPGDVIVTIEGQPVDDRHSLVSLLLEHVAGETITLEVTRNGQTIQTELTLGERV